MTDIYYIGFPKKMKQKINETEGRSEQKREKQTEVERSLHLQTSHTSLYALSFLKTKDPCTQAQIHLHTHHIQSFTHTHTQFLSFSIRSTTLLKARRVHWVTHSSRDLCFKIS